MKGRAITPEAKRAVVERLLRAWLAAPHLRLGQLLIAACEHRARPVDPFHVEDESLAALVEELSPPAPHDLTPSAVALAKVIGALDRLLERERAFDPDGQPVRDLTKPPKRGAR